MQQTEVKTAPKSMPPQTPLFSSVWVALFAILRENQQQKEDKEPAQLGD